MTEHVYTRKYDLEKYPDPINC